MQSKCYLGELEEERREAKGAGKRYAGRNEIKKYIPKACPIPLQRRSIIRIYYHFRGARKGEKEKRKRGYPSSRGIRRRRLGGYTLSSPLLCKRTAAISLGEKRDGK